MCADGAYGKDVNEHCGKISDIIIRNCLASNANDNLTCIFVCFENFKNLLFDSNNNFNLDKEKFENILSNIKTINVDSFSEKENDSGEWNSMTISSNYIQTNVSNNNINKPQNNINQKSENNILEKKKEKKNLQLNLNPNIKLNSPPMMKVLSPLNNKTINKYFSPTNLSLTNFNSNLVSGINNNNQYMNQINNINSASNNNNEEGILINKKVYSNKTVNISSKLDLISPKNSGLNLNKKSNRNVSDDKFKSLPAINMNGSMKKVN
jgi:hypothetical protein